MANWLNKIDLQPEFGICEENETKESLKEVCIKAKNELQRPFTISHTKKVEPEHIKNKREEIIEQFDSLIDDCDSGYYDYSELEGQFNYILEDMYDFGDSYVGRPIDKMLWINTI